MPCFLGFQKKDKKAWKGDNPKKETFKLWVQFIKDNFEDGDEPAGLEGPPKFFRLQGPRQERRGAINMVHGNPAPFKGEGVGRRAVERARRWGFFASISGQQDDEPACKSCLGRALFILFKYAYRTCCIPSVSVWRLSRFCIAIVLRWTQLI